MNHISLSDILEHAKTAAPMKGDHVIPIESDDFIQELRDDKILINQIYRISINESVEKFIKLTNENKAIIMPLFSLYSEIKRKKKELEIQKEFLYMVTHDLRNPIGIISICADFLLTSKHSVETNPKTAEFLSRIKGQSMRALSLVNSILEESKVEQKSALILSETNLWNYLKPIIKDMQFIAAKSKVKILLCDPKNVLVPLDRNKIQHVVENLLSNSIKFSPADSTILVDFGLEKIDGQSYASISIIDEGRGIPQEKLESIFSKFSQAGDKNSKQLGVGLGLFIVKEFVHFHQGLIQVSNNEDKGSTFKVLIPHAHSHDVTTDVKPGLNKILIADDDEDIRFVISEALDQLNVEYIEAVNGLDAFDQYVRFKPDLIISDIKMPQSDGIEFAQKVKSSDSNVPIIFMSGFYDELDQERAKKVFNTEYMLHKPFSKEDIIQLVSPYLQDKKDRNKGQ